MSLSRRERSHSSLLSEDPRLADDQARDALDRARELCRHKGAAVGEAIVDRHAAALSLG